MNRKLSYNGKELHQMSTDELKAQLKINQYRLKALLLAFVNPILSVIPIVILLITRYWLLQNNYAIKQEINRR